MVQKIPTKEKIGYALGDMAANFVFQAMLALQLSFYTDTFGLSAAQAGTLFLTVGLGVACLNPIMGIIADRTASRWGKFRPWLLWTAVPFGVINVLTFTTPNISADHKLIYAWVTYILLRVIYVVNNVPYASLMAVMSSDPDERTSISSYRQIAANAAGFVIQSLAIPMVGFFGRGNDMLGYQLTMGFLSIVSIVLFIIAFVEAKERVQPDPRQKTSLKRDFLDLAQNRAWVMLFFVTLFYFVAVSIRSSVMLPFFKYCVGNEQLFSWFNGVGLTGVIVGVAVSTPLALAVEKRRLFIISLVGTGTLCAVLAFIPPHATTLIIACEFVRQFVFGCSVPLLWAMMGDVADFGEQKTGRRASATATAGIVFALWAGLAIGGAAVGWLFAYYGYVANTVQTERLLMGIRLTASIYSGVMFFCSAILLFWYPLTSDACRSISAELARRRELCQSQRTSS